MLFLFVLAHFGHHLLTALPAPLLPLIRDDFALDYTQAGLVVAAFSLAYGLGQLPAGLLADRVGARILITVGLFGVAVAGLLVGLSRSYMMMIVFLVLMGIAGGGYHPSAAPLISASVEPKNQGRALGLHMIGGSGSFFLAPLAAAALATLWGWRGSFIALAIPTAVFGIVFYVLLGRRTSTIKAQQMVISPQNEAAPPSGRVRRLVVFMILSMFVQAVISAAVSFIPIFMVDHFGIAEGTAAAFLSIVYSAGLWAGPLGGYLSDRWGRVPVILAISLIAGPVTYLLNLASYPLGFGALLLLIGVIMYVRMPVSEAYIFGQTPERHRSTMFGIYYFANMEAGGLLTPVVGSSIDRFGFYDTFTVAGGALVVVTLICFFFLRGSRN